MHQKFNKIKDEALQAFKAAATLELLQEVRNVYLSKRGIISELMGALKELPAEEKKPYGQAVNDLRNIVEKTFNEIRESLLAASALAKLSQEKIDLTLPGRFRQSGPLHPFHLVKDEITNIFLGMGFDVVEGQEVEDDHYNFTLLNMPANHPARDMQDSFYLDEKKLLRTHTSPVQARVMQASNGASIKMISPGKTYRRDDDDNTHSHQFGQIEGLVIGKDITLGHLKATLDLFLKKMFGEKRIVRFRPSYFPFTEPSVEVDISCHECGGKGCSTCKGTGYIEILGAGMVNPNVLAMNGYDPRSVTGFAFGVGIERVAMLRYGIDDIRRFYQNDVRFLNQFPKA